MIVIVIIIIIIIIIRTYEYVVLAYRPQMEPSQLCALNRSNGGAPPASHFASLDSLGALGLELFAGSDRVAAARTAPGERRRAGGAAAPAHSDRELADPAVVAFDNFLVADSKLVADRFALDTALQRRAAGETRSDVSFRVCLTPSPLSGAIVRLLCPEPFSGAL